MSFSRIKTVKDMWKYSIYLLLSVGLYESETLIAFYLKQTCLAEEDPSLSLMRWMRFCLRRTYRAQTKTF